LNADKEYQRNIKKQQLTDVFKLIVTCIKTEVCLLQLTGRYCLCLSFSADMGILLPITRAWQARGQNKEWSFKREK
jgi:hypothetical protein